MSSKANLTNIGGQDWSNFDFSRWNLEGLKLDSQTSAFAGWIRDVTTSSQAPQKFAAGLAAVKSAIANDLKDRVQNIQNTVKAADAELASRVAATQTQIAAIQENIRVAGIISVVAGDPEAFQVTAKLVDEPTRLGLPGLQVRIFDSRTPSVTLARTTTDLNGNALLKLNRDQTENLARSNAEIAMEVLTPGNKSVAAGIPVSVPKLNQVGTVLTPLKASPDLQPHLDAANAAMAQQQALLSAFTAKIESLRPHYQQIKDGLQQQLQQTQQIITDLQKGSS